MFNNDACEPGSSDCSEHQTYLLDAVELNSRMGVKTELMKISDMTEQLQLIGLSILYAGICPIGTAIVFVFFICDDFMARYTDCFCMRRPISENSMSLEGWIFVVEFFVGLVSISNSAILFLVSRKFKQVLSDDFKIAPQNHLWFVGIFEHFLFLVTLLTKFFIPDFPRKIKKFYEHQKHELEESLNRSKIKYR